MRIADPCSDAPILAVSDRRSKAGFPLAAVWGHRQSRYPLFGTRQRHNSILANRIIILRTVKYQIILAHQQK